MQYFWVQEKVHQQQMSVQKVGTKDNPADMFTKGLKCETLDEHVAFIRGYVCEKRDKSALKLNTVLDHVGLSDKWGPSSGTMLVRSHFKP